MRRILTFLKIFRYDLVVMLIALRHRDTPRRVKGLLALAILYLVSPIDLIPDTIPLVGILDDAVIVPAAGRFSWAAKSKDLIPPATL